MPWCTANSIQQSSVSSNPKRNTTNTEGPSSKPRASHNHSHRQPSNGSAATRVQSTYRANVIRRGTGPSVGEHSVRPGPGTRMSCPPSPSDRVASWDSHYSLSRPTSHSRSQPTPRNSTNALRTSPASGHSLRHFFRN